MALSTTANYSLRKHDAGDLNWDIDVNWNATEIDKKLKLLFSNFLTCSTAIDTAAKTAAFANFVLEAGCLIAVKFTNGNSASGATLNVNSTGAKAIQYNGSAIPPNAIVPNGVYLLAYDGTNWAMLNPVTVSDAITEDETGLAPTQNAVFDALALKTDSSDVAVTAAANKIPKADALGKIDLGYLPAATLPDIALGDAGKVLSVNSTEDGLEYTGLPLASTTDKGIVELATSAEVLAGTDDERAVSPASLKSIVDVEGGLASTDYADGKITQTITEGVEDKAPSEGAVFDALALKADAADVMNAPASSVNENIPIFDGVTGDKLKDSGVKLSDKADVAYVEYLMMEGDPA